MRKLRQRLNSSVGSGPVRYERKLLAITVQGSQNLCLLLAIYLLILQNIYLIIKNSELKIEEIILKLIIVKNQIEISDDPKKQKTHSRNFSRLRRQIKYIGTIEKHLFKKEEMKNLAKLIKKLNKNEKGKLILKKFYLEEKEEIEKMCENFRKGLSVNEHVNY